MFLGYSQAVRQQTLNLPFPWFESTYPSHDNAGSRTGSFFLSPVHALPALHGAGNLPQRFPDWSPAGSAGIGILEKVTGVMELNLPAASGGSLCSTVNPKSW